MNRKLKTYKEIERGGLIDEPGNAAEYNTGSWRSERPIWIKENCIQCMFCWIYCPDLSVTVKDGKREDFDYYHCKGCGICALECPAKTKAIVMLTEAEGQEPDAGEKARAIAKKMAEAKAQKA